MAARYKPSKGGPRHGIVAEQISLFSHGDINSLLRLRQKPRPLSEFSCELYSPRANEKLGRFVEVHRTTHRSLKTNAFSEDILAGKNTYVYDAHTYHTKVPPAAVKQLIEHYTKANDLILDPFCGSGMTGVAALQTGRKPILIDLSPAATFISFNFLTPVDARKFVQTVNLISNHLAEEENTLYGTYCRTCRKLVPMEYMVWSYGLLCQFCNQEFVLWNVARDERESVRESKIRSEFDCPHCGNHVLKRRLHRTRLYPVQIGYRCCNSRLAESKAVPDEHDLSVVEAAASRRLANELWYPTASLPEGVNTRQAIVHGLDSVDKLYTARNLQGVARLWDIARRWPDDEISLKLLFTATSLYQRVTKLSEFRFWGGSGNIANYNVPMIFNEQNVFRVFRRKAKTIRDYLESSKSGLSATFCISTQSATDLSAIPNKSIDYVFTDPPFGGNINYSEMNYLWEAWLNIFTDPANEAIVNRIQGKSVEMYGRLMTQSLCEIYRVLKPDRWLTLVFHNSSAAVWATVQQALSDSGLTVVRTQALDKQHGTFKQFVSDNTVGYDLMLQCRKGGRTAKSWRMKMQPADVRSTIRDFLRRTLAHNPSRFIVRYLHVKRPNELDHRKLYSLWLKERVESGETVRLSFEKFRKAVNLILKTKT